MQIISTNFDNLEPIPDRYSPYDKNINPLLTFSEVPDKAESLALIVEDPDAPGGIFTHWILYNLSPGTLQIIEGELPISGSVGVNSRGETKYTGPKPPSGTHRYIFKLFALDTMFEFDEGTQVDRDAMYEAMDNHIIEEAEIIGTFASKEN